MDEQKQNSPKPPNSVTAKQEASVFGVSASDRLLGELEKGNNIKNVSLLLLGYIHFITNSPSKPPFRCFLWGLFKLSSSSSNYQHKLLVESLTQS